MGCSRKEIHLEAQPFPIRRGLEKNNRGYCRADDERSMPWETTGNLGTAITIIF
jgi:hypothetical protein